MAVRVAIEDVDIKGGPKNRASAPPPLHRAAQTCWEKVFPGKISEKLYEGGKRAEKW